MAYRIIIYAFFTDV